MSVFFSSFFGYNRRRLPHRESVILCILSTPADQNVHSMTDVLRIAFFRKSAAAVLRARGCMGLGIA